MKLSSLDDSPHFNPKALKAKVFLEGAERKNVVFADEEGRHATLYKLDHNGNPKMNLKTGEPEFEEFWGHVRIDIPEEPQASGLQFELGSGGMVANGDPVQLVYDPDGDFGYGVSCYGGDGAVLRKGDSLSITTVTGLNLGTPVNVVSIDPADPVDLSMIVTGSITAYFNDPAISSYMVTGTGQPKVEVSVIDNWSKMADELVARVAEMRRAFQPIKEHFLEGKPTIITEEAKRRAESAWPFPTKDFQ